MPGAPASRESDVRIVVVEALDTILPTMPVRLQQKATRYLERQGVEVMLKSPIVGAGPGHGAPEGRQGHRGARPSSGPAASRAASSRPTCGLVKGKCSNRLCKFATTQGTCGLKECQFGGDRYVEGKRGRLLVNERMQTPDYPEVYVVGDVGWYLEGEKVLPQIVETAVQTGATAAHNIIADIRDEQPQVPSVELPRQHGLARRAKWGVAYVGMGRLMLPLSGIFAMVAKHAINVLHLPRRGGHQPGVGVPQARVSRRQGPPLRCSAATSRVPTRGYWVAILRVFLGVMWLIEGITKIVNGWLKPGEDLHRAGRRGERGQRRAGRRRRGGRGCDGRGVGSGGDGRRRGPGRHPGPAARAAARHLHVDRSTPSCRRHRSSSRP